MSPGTPTVVAAADPTGAPAAEALALAAAHLRAGHPVALPTDTVYGLAALPTVAGATAALFALKGRSADVPVAVLCASADQAFSLVDEGAVTAEVRRIAARLWPGPLTLVLPRRPGLGYDLGARPTTIGLRCPDQPLLRALAAEVGPLATTSANLHGEPTPPTAAGVAALFGGALALVLDGGPCEEPPSTVVDATGGSDATGSSDATVVGASGGTGATGDAGGECSEGGEGGPRAGRATGGGWRLLRPGVIGLADIEAAARA